MLYDKSQMIKHFEASQEVIANPKQLENLACTHQMREVEGKLPPKNYQSIVDRNTKKVVWVEFSFKMWLGLWTQDPHRLSLYFILSR